MLQEKQMIAIELLCQGKTKAETCREINLSRRTLYNWLNDQEFNAELERLENAKILGGNPNGIISFNQTPHKWATELYNNMLERTWFSKQVNISKDKVNYFAYYPYVNVPYSETSVVNGILPSSQVAPFDPNADYVFGVLNEKYDESNMPTLSFNLNNHLFSIVKINIIYIQIY